MSKPEYPTKEGLWSRGKRKEDKFNEVELGLPYAKAVENLRGAMEGRDDFDPAVLFVWGTMQATAVLNILKAVEEKYGQEGQEVVRTAIQQAGYEAAEQFIQNSKIPEDLDGIELVSFVATGINTILYASLERPSIVSEDRCDFDILWCPHQDRYTAFDCRVQRYFVEGIIRAIERKELGRFVPEVEKLIPMGADCCHFVINRLEDDGGQHPWDLYSDDLGERALEKLKKK
jgi:hypothetical protein